MNNTKIYCIHKKRQINRDWSYETTQTSVIAAMVIMNSGVGKFGNEDNGWCLEDENFGQGSYRPYWCDHPNHDDIEGIIRVSENVFVSVPVSDHNAS